MPLRMSGKQLNKLGKRLASPEPITDEDYVLLAQVAEDYQAVLDKVEEGCKASDTRRQLASRPPARWWTSCAGLRISPESHP